jgi:thiamine-phosphate pyrophosphorylase
VKPVARCGLYGILDTGYVAADRMTRMAVSLIEGGIDILQLRAKKESRDEIRAMALEIAPICRQANVPFILNDHPDLVAETGADGVHVGQEDYPIADARRLAGPGALVGKSTHSLEQALAAAAEAPDYIGFGPLFATPTKPDYRPIGTDQVRKLHQLLTLPIFCIGGIKLANLSSVINAGAQRVVIVSDLLQAADPRASTERCKSLILESAR